MAELIEIGWNKTIIYNNLRNYRIGLWIARKSLSICLFNDSQRQPTRTARLDYHWSWDLVRRNLEFTTDED